jgi:hypothetical protein
MPINREENHNQLIKTGVNGPLTERGIAEVWPKKIKIIKEEKIENDETYKYLYVYILLVQYYRLKLSGSTLARRHLPKPMRVSLFVRKKRPSMFSNTANILYPK